MEETQKNSSHLVINPREGFFHAMLSYRVNTDGELVTKIHDKLHLLAPSARKSVSEMNQLLDSHFPLDAGFKQDPSTYNSSLHVFLDSYCLKDGVGWEGDGGAKSGGFVGAVRLSPVFVPLLSATEIVTEDTELAQKGSGKGSVGQMINLAHKDMQDNVLLELIVARELHKISKESSKTNRKKVLAPCSYIFPLFRNGDVWKAASFLPKTASALTNDKAKKVLNQMGILDEAISPELRNGTLTVHAVWEFFTQFQGIQLHAHGEERFQVAAAANAIIGVIDNVRSIVTESKFDDLKMNSSQMYELSGFMSQLNLSNYTPILAIHHISNVYQLAELKQSRADTIVQSIAEYGVRASDNSALPVELSKVQSAINAAHLSPLAKPLDNRFRDFIDRDASFVTILSHSSLFDIILSKKITVGFLFLACVVIVIQVISGCTADNTGMVPACTGNIPMLAVLALIFSSCLISVVISPRSGRYTLAVAFLLYAITETVFFIISAFSAIHSDCAKCAWRLPPEVRSTMTRVEELLQQNTMWPMWWGLFFCSLFKQNWTFPIVFLFQLIDVILKFSAGWSVWVKLHFYNGSGFWQFVGSFSSLFVSLKLFQYFGRRRALSIYDLNARNIEVAYQELREAEVNDPSSRFGKLVALSPSEPQPSQSTCFGIFAHKQQNPEQTEMTEVNVSEATPNCGENRREEAQPLKETAQKVHTPSQAKTPGKSQNVRIRIEDTFKTENSLQGEVLQDQNSFEQLIQDAEFINDAFQVWASSWLIGGPDFDVVQKYFFTPTETFGPEDIEKCFCNLSRKPKPGGKTTESASENRSEAGGSDQDSVNGKRVRGPLKHIDRAIAKVSGLFCNFNLQNRPENSRFISDFAAGNSYSLSHCNTIGAPCILRRFQEVDGHCPMLSCGGHT
jgi:hypothetical protein